jgi:hypothetical protein
MFSIRQFCDLSTKIFPYGVEELFRLSTVFLEERKKNLKHPHLLWCLGRIAGEFLLPLLAVHAFGFGQVPQLAELEHAPAFVPQRLECRIAAQFRGKQTGPSTGRTIRLLSGG